MTKIEIHNLRVDAEKARAEFVKAFFARLFHIGHHHAHA